MRNDPHGDPPEYLGQELNKLIDERHRIHFNRRWGNSYDAKRLVELDELIDAFWLLERQAMQDRVITAETIEQVVQKYLETRACP